MDKLNNFKGGVELISGVTPKNNNDFALMDAHFVQVDENDKRLDERLYELANAATIEDVFNDKRYTDLNGQVQTNKENIGTIMNTDLPNANTKAEEAKTLAETIQKAFKLANGQQLSWAEGSIDLSNLGGNYDIWYDEETYYLYLFDKTMIPDGETFDPKEHPNAIKGFTYIQGGGGGSGTGTQSTVILTRIGATTYSIKKGASLPLSFKYETQDANKQPMGVSGTAKVYVNNVLQTSFEAKEGTSTIDVGPYIPNGTATVRIYVSNIFGAASSLYYTVTGVELGISSTFSDGDVKTTDVRLPISYSGAVAKTLHYSIDGYERTAELGTSSGTYTITVPMDKHGVKIVKAYITASLEDGTELQTETLYYEILFGDSKATTTLIRCNYDGSILQQYTTHVFKYTVYNPSSTTSLVTIKVDGEVKTTTSVTATEQAFSYKPMTAGNHTLTFESNGTIKTVSFTVETFEDADKTRPITDGLTFELTPEGRTNADVDRDIYENNGYKLTFSKNFDWYNGGWLVDENNVDYLCIKAGDTVTVNYPLFDNDNETKTNGKNFKVIFKATNCKKFDAQVMSTITSMNAIVTETTKDENDKGTTVTKDVINKIGVELTAQNGTVYYGSYKGVEAPYVEDELLEFECNIQSTNEYNEIIDYLSADPVSCKIYDTNASFGQRSYASSFTPIVFGSPDCDVHLYKFKVYERSLSMDETMQNYYGDSLTAEIMSERYKRNQILDDDGEVDYTKLSQLYPDMRIILITCPRFTNDKNDKVQNCTVQQIMGNNDPKHNWTAEGVQIKGQGTSSNEYGTSARNIDISCKKGFTDANGEPFELYTMTDDSIGQNYFNIKVNVASSENANNACLAERYNAYQPFKRPAKEANPKVRDTMEFHPCVIYIQETGVDANGTAVEPQEFEADKKFHFYAAGDFGNSKKNSTAMGMTDNPLECIIEFSNNTSPQCLFQKDSNGTTIEKLKFDDKEGVESGSFWDGEVFEFRYPDVKDFTIAEKTKSDFLTKRTEALKEELKAQYLKEAEDAGTTLSDTELTEKVNKEIATPERQAELDAAATKDDEEYRAGRDQNKRYIETMVDNFKEVWEWTESTNQETVTNEVFSEPKTIKNSPVKWTQDTLEYRKTKFTNEVSDHYVVDSLLFHYLFTERFTMIDNRAKNTFIHYNPEGNESVAGKWDFVFDYDNDTALGCDNSGNLTMTYGLEDIDKFDTGAWIFNGALSGLWCNVRDCLDSQLRSMALSLSDCWSGSSVINMFNNYQEFKPEVLQMKDMWKKYLRPYEGYLKPTGTYVKETRYIEKLNGRKKYQRARYETYQDAYFASKYNIGTALNDSISMRVEGAIGNSSIPFGDTFTLTPYCDLYVSMYFDGPTRTIRAKSGKPTEIKIPEGSYQDKNITIRSASWLQDIGDLSPFYIHDAGFGAGKKLKVLQIGNADSGYVNSHFDQLGVDKTNTLLEEIDLRGCAMTKNPIVNLSQVPTIKKLYTTNSKVSSVAFANGGMVDTADLNEISSLTIQNLYYLENFSLSSYDNLTRLNYENCPYVNELDLIQKTNKLSEVRLIGVNWTDSGDNHRGQLPDTKLLNRLLDMTGINEAGNGVNQSVLTGKIKVQSKLRPSEMRTYEKAWDAGFDENSEKPLIILGTGVSAETEVIFLGAEGEILYSEYVEDGNFASDPIKKGYIETPTKAFDDRYNYTFKEWSINVTSTPIMSGNPSIENGQLFIKALFNQSDRSFTVIWKKGTTANSDVMASTVVTYGKEAVYENAYEGSLAYPTKEDEGVAGVSVTKTYLFKNWDKSTGYVTQDLIVYPVFEEGTFKGTEVEPDYINMTPADLAVYVKNFELNSNLSHGLGSADTNTSGKLSFFRQGTKISVQMGYMPDFEGQPNETENSGIIKSEVIVGEGSAYGMSEPLQLNSEDKKFYEVKEVKLLDEDKAFVLALDFSSGYKEPKTQTQDTDIYNTIFSIPGTQNSNSFNALETAITLEQNEAPTIKGGDSSTPQKISELAPYMVGQTNNADKAQYYYNPRQIIVIRHSKGQQGLTVYYQDRSKYSIGLWNPSYAVDSIEVKLPISTYPSDGDSVYTSDAGILFGARKKKNGDLYCYGQGKINYCKIWYGDLGERECQKIATWVYDKRTFSVGTGDGAYSIVNSGDVTKLTFIDDGLLDIDTVYNRTSSNVGGYKYSLVRNYLNGTVYNGFDCRWRSLFKLVVVRSIKGGFKDGTKINPASPGKLFPTETDTEAADTDATMNTVIPSQNYLYLPSYAEIGGGSVSGDYKNDLVSSSKYFSTYTTPENRIKKIETYVDPTQETPLDWGWMTRTASMGTNKGVGNVSYKGAISTSQVEYTDDRTTNNVTTQPLGIALCFSV